MTVVSPHIWYPSGSGTAYDLRKVESWWISSDDASQAQARFVDGHITPNSFVLSDFETAIADSLGADPATAESTLSTYFDGVSDYLYSDDPVFYPDTDESFTIIFWANGGGAKNVVCSNTVTPLSAGFYLDTLDSTTRYRLFIRDGTAAVQADTPRVIGAWAKYAFVYDADAQELRAYTDDVLGDTESTAAVTGSIVGGDGFTIARGVATREWFSGYLDEFIFTRQALTLPEIQLRTPSITAPIVDDVRLRMGEQATGLTMPNIGLHGPDSVQLVNMTTVNYAGDVP